MDARGEDRRAPGFAGVASLALTITMQGWDGKQALPWCGSGVGFDGWAEAAQRRPAYSDVGRSYCLAGGARLRRRWEVASRSDDPGVSCLFHAWEGGSGLSDCLDASRAFGPPGETWSLIATYRL